MFFGLFGSTDILPQVQISGPKWKANSPRKSAHKVFSFKNKALGKTLKFRAVTLVTTLAITWILTGNPVTSVGLTVIQQGTNTAVYYFFEKNEKKRHFGRLENN